LLRRRWTAKVSPILWMDTYAGLTMAVRFVSKIRKETAPERKARLQREAGKRFREKHASEIAESKREKRRLASAKWREENMHLPEVREKYNALARRSYHPRIEQKRVERAGRPKPELCELCGLPGKIFFDHCHLSGTFRGWICLNCNCALGHAKDNPELLRKMADYLEKWSDGLCR
jgi:hypothetical protein